MEPEVSLEDGTWHAMRRFRHHQKHPVRRTRQKCQREEHHGAKKNPMSPSLVDRNNKLIDANTWTEQTNNHIAPGENAFETTMLERNQKQSASAHIIATYSTASWTEPAHGSLRSPVLSTTHERRKGTGFRDVRGGTISFVVAVLARTSTQGPKRLPNICPRQPVRG